MNPGIQINPETMKTCRERAETCLRKFREEFGIWETPVDCFRLTDKLNASGKISIQRAEAEGLSDDFDGVTYYFPEEKFYLICHRPVAMMWKSRSVRRRINFTLAHELGHIFCGHLAVPDPLKTPETRALEDAEADAFAAELLTPKDVLGHFRSVKEAADALLVSESAVRRRTRDTGILFALRTCPNCGFNKIPPAADYCRMCGECLQETPHPPKERDVIFYPPPPEECPVCGYKNVSTEDGRCLYCDASKRNYCMPEYSQMPHWCPEDAKYCETCGAPTLYKELLGMQNI